MNVLLVYEASFARYGGTQTYLRKIAAGLKERGINVYVAYPLYAEDENLSVEGAISIPFKQKRFPNYGTNVKTFLNSFNNSILQIIEKKQIDIIHVIFGWFAFALIDYSKINRAGIKCFVTIHNVPPQESASSFKGDSLYRRGIELVKYSLRIIRSFIQIQMVDKRVGIIVPCENVRKRLNKYLCRNQVFVVPHGYDENLVNKRNNLTLQKHEYFTVLSVGGIAPGKNQALLVDVFNSIAEKDRFRVQIAGGAKRNPRYVEYIKNRVKKEKLDNVFEFYFDCSEEQLIKLYERADLYVQPSTDEGFCLTALDAAAMGLRVVGSDVGEIAKIAQMSGGRIVKYNDANDFRRAIQELSHATVCKKETGNMITNTYNWNKTIDRILNIYKTFLTDE